MVTLLLAAVLASAGTTQLPGTFVWTGKSAADNGLEWTLPKVDSFDRAVVSWNAKGPVTVVLQVAGQEHVMGVWGDKPSSRTTAFVDEDTLKLPQPATALRVKVLPAPGSEVTLLAVTYWKRGAVQPMGPVSADARGRTVAGVPHLVQRDQKTCSPTSLTMVLKHYGVAASLQAAIDGVKDHAPDASEVYGNWPFNTAYAYKASGGKLQAYVRRMAGLAELEEETAGGNPAIISFKPNGPDGQGHLVVVLGFTPSGDVVVNDPGRRDGEERVVPRKQFYQAWLRDGQGVAYVFRLGNG